MEMSESKLPIRTSPAHDLSFLALNYNSLTQDEVDAFNSTWCMCDRVQITDSKLNVKPYR